MTLPIFFAALLRVKLNRTITSLKSFLLTVMARYLLSLPQLSKCYWAGAENLKRCSGVEREIKTQLGIVPVSSFKSCRLSRLFVGLDGNHFPKNGCGEADGFVLHPRVFFVRSPVDKSSQ